MAEVRVTWLQDFQFVGSDSTNHSVVLSKPGEDSVGMRPSDLLLVALAGCTGIDVVNILLKKRVKLTGLRIRVNGEQAPLPPWAFEKIHVRYEASGTGLTEKDFERAITLSHEKYCSVSATLKAQAEITWEYEIVER